MIITFLNGERFGISKFGKPESKIISIVSIDNSRRSHCNITDFSLCNILLGCSHVEINSDNIIIESRIWLHVYSHIYDSTITLRAVTAERRIYFWAISIYWPLFWYWNDLSTFSPRTTVTSSIEILSYWYILCIDLSGG